MGARGGQRTASFKSAAVPTGFEPADGWGQARPVSVSRSERGLAHCDRNGPLCHGTAAGGDAQPRSDRA